jgi:hypothetical protein
LISRILIRQEKSNDELCAKSGGNLCPLRRAKIVNFHERNAGRIIRAIYDHSVSTGIEQAHNRGFQVIRRRYGGRDDFSLLAACAPVVVPGATSRCRRAIPKWDQLICLKQARGGEEI